MADTFDINNRRTWAWSTKAPAEGLVRLDDSYALSIDDPTCFYQYNSSGRALQHNCALETDTDRQVFDPRLEACVAPVDLPESEVYEWAVAGGHVTDQR